MEYFKGYLLTIMTFGIYSSWFTVNIRNYVFSHIRFGNAEFYYEGDGADYLLIHIKGIVLTILTLGIYSFWYAKDLYNFYVNNLVIHQNDYYRYHFSSTATPKGMFFLFGGNLLITVFSLGLATPWATIRTVKYFLENATIEEGFNPDTLEQTEGLYADATADDIGSMLDLDLV